MMETDGEWPFFRLFFSESSSRLAMGYRFSTRASMSPRAFVGERNVSFSRRRLRRRVFFAQKNTALATNECHGGGVVRIAKRRHERLQSIAAQNELGFDELDARALAEREQGLAPFGLQRDVLAERKGLLAPVALDERALGHQHPYRLLAVAVHFQGDPKFIRQTPFTVPVIAPGLGVCRIGVVFRLAVITGLFEPHDLRDEILELHRSAFFARQPEPFGVIAVIVRTDGDAEAITEKSLDVVTHDDSLRKRWPKTKKTTVS